MPKISGIPNQTFVTSLFKQDNAIIVAKGFCASDIPLHKLQHRVMKKMFQELGVSCRSESTCREQVAMLAAHDEIIVKEKVSDTP